MNKLMQRGFVHALATGVYITIIVTLLQNAQHIFGPTDPITAPIIALMTLVISAAITGGLVVGKPILMYIDNQKADAVRLFMYTIGWLAILLVIVIIVTVLIK